MTVAVALLRGINVGGKNSLPMERLRGLCERAGWKDARTFIQSGNVAFRLAGRGKADGAALRTLIERECGFRPEVVVRTLAELRAAIRDDPLAARTGLEPNRHFVMFLASPPSASARKAAATLKHAPEELHLGPREAYLYYPSGGGRAKTTTALVEKTLGTAGTCRNWNTVQKLLAMAEELDGAGG